MGKWSTYRRRGSSTIGNVVNDFVARVVTNGGTVSAATQTALNAMVTSLYNAGLWTLLTEIWPCCGTGLPAALVKLKWSPTSPSIWGNTGFTGADYAETGGSGGLAGNGATKSLQGGISAAELGLNGHMACFVAAVTAGAGNRAFCGVIAGSDQYWMGGLVPASATDVRMGQTTTASVAAAMASGAWIGVRRANNDLALYKNGSSVGTSATVTTGSTSNNQIGLFCYMSAGSPAAFSDARMTGHTSGPGLTAGQVTSLNTIWGTFNTALSR